MSAGSRTPGFGTSMLWSWGLVAINLSTAVFVAPLLVRRLGDEAYGLWALAFSLVEYFGLLDMGIRSALVKYVAQHRALCDDARLQRALQTGVIYFMVMGAVLLAITVILAPFGPRFFAIPPALSETFVSVELIVGAAWAIGVACQCFLAGLEAAQRFDLSNRAIILASLARVVALVTLLLMGFGLTAVVAAAAGARLLQCAISWVFFTRAFPAFRFRLSTPDRETLGLLLSFGVQTVPSTIGKLMLTQGPAIVIGHTMPVQFVGYYALPGRLTFTVLDLVYRMAAITTARSAELSAHGRKAELIRLAVMSNRYSLLVVVPFAALLLCYGDALFAVWLTPAFARASAPLLPLFVAGALGEAAHYNSGSILYGLAKHRTLARMLLAEAIVSLSVIAHFTSRGDLWRAALVSTVVLVLNRACVTPILLCRQLNYPVVRYMAEVMGGPMSVLLATSLLLRLSRATWLTGDNLIQIVAAGALSGASCLVLAGRFCLLKDHQVLALDILRRRAPFAVPAARVWFGAGPMSATA